jgi:hypothetical protein
MESADEKDAHHVVRVACLAFALMVDKRQQFMENVVLASCSEEAWMSSIAENGKRNLINRRQETIQRRLDFSKC